MAEPLALSNAEDDPAVPMASWEAEAVQDYGKTYARKYSDFRDDQATVWTSMYEKNLGRKVSRLPPWESNESGRKESEDRRFGDPSKRDFATVHLQRAADSGALHHKKHFETAEQRRAKRKEKKSRSSSDSSKENEATADPKDKNRHVEEETSNQ